MATIEYRTVLGPVTVEWAKAGEKSYANSAIAVVTRSDGKDRALFSIRANATRDELMSAGAAFRDAMLACAARIKDLDAAPPVTPVVTAGPTEAEIQARIEKAIAEALAAQRAVLTAPPVTPPVTPKAKAKVTPPVTVTPPAQTGAEAINTLPF